MLDDLQWADEATLGWLRYLAGRWEEVGLVIIATTWTRSSPGLDALRHAWQRANRYAASDLAGLSAVAVAELLHRLPAPPRIAARIHAVTEGNPFFILEIIRHLRETGRSADAAEDSSLPETVRDAILARLSFLSPLARQLLESAVVLAPHVDDQLLQQTAARTASEVADALDELFAHQLLKPAAPPAPESDLRLGHYLLQTVVYQELSPWRRRLLHGRAGTALTRLRPENAAVLAQHFTQAASWERAFVCYQQAATQAEQAHAYDVALEQIDHAFAILAHLSEPKAARLTLLRRRLALARILVQLPTWRADADEVRQLAEQAGATEALLEALEAQMSLQVLQSHFGEVEATAAHALTLATKSGNQVAAARIRQTLGWHLADALGRSRAGLVHLQEARRLAEAAGEQHLLYQILCHLAFALRAEGRCAAARDSAERALALRVTGRGTYPIRTMPTRCASWLRPTPISVAGKMHGEHSSP